MLVDRASRAKVADRLSGQPKSHIYNTMRLCVAAAALLAIATPAGAQSAGTLEFSALGVWHNKTTTMDALRGFGFGSRVGVWLPAGFELEGQADVTLPANSIVVNRFKLYHLAGSLVFNVPAGSASLYLRGGYGKLLPRGCTFNGPCSSHGAATGGAGFRVPLGGGLFLRAEGMYRTRTVYDYRSFGGSVGFSLLSRSAGPTGLGPDDDGDGVANRRDRCRDTPRGALVDTRGCATDSDRDGVVDGVDRCPATPANTEVDRFGCPARRPD